MIYELKLYCGTKSFSKSLEARGIKTETLDNDPRFQPTFLMDVRDFLAFAGRCDDLTAMIKSQGEPRYNILWASQPCQCFSKMSAKHHWERCRSSGNSGMQWYEPKSAAAREAITLVKETALIIARLKPDFWFIENPVGMLRFHLPAMLQAYGIKDFERRTVTYCQYGESYQKPTDIWTNFSAWKPRPCCKQGDPCHERVTAGSRAGTMRLKTNVHRAIVPAQLCDEIANLLSLHYESRGEL